jgi:ribosomal protein S6--L-glutamate ligase
MHVVDYLRCYLDINSRSPRVLYSGRDLNDFDAIIPRIGASNTFYGMAVLRQFEIMGVFSVNASEAIARSRDKLRCLQLLSAKRIGLPVTSFAYSPADIPGAIDLVEGAPLVVKLIEGTQGVGVILAETEKVAETVMEAFRGQETNVLAQEYIAEAQGCDVRCFIVGGKVVAAMERQAAEGDFRSNLHRGGTSRRATLAPHERRVAIKAAAAMGLSVAGVDMLRSRRGPLVIEVNSSPGLEGIESTSGIDVAEKVIRFVEEHTPATRGRLGSRE